MISVSPYNLKEINDKITNEIANLKRYFNNPNNLAHYEYDKEIIDSYVHVNIEDIIINLTTLSELKNKLASYSANLGLDYANELVDGKRLATVSVEKENKNIYTSNGYKNKVVFTISLQVKTEKGIEIHTDSKTLLWNDRGLIDSVVEEYLDIARETYGIEEIIIDR